MFIWLIKYSRYDTGQSKQGVVVRVVSVNVNGIRSAHRKGFFDWMQKQCADVICIQETKAQVAQLSEEILQPKGYYAYFNDALKKGYSGVAVYSRKEPEKISAAGRPHTPRRLAFSPAVSLSLFGRGTLHGPMAQMRQHEPSAPIGHGFVTVDLSKTVIVSS